METKTRKARAPGPAKSEWNGLARRTRTPVRQKKKVASDGKATSLRRGVARSLRSDFGLSLPTLSRMVGVPVNALARWEANGVALKGAAGARTARVAAILARLAGIMRRSYIPRWLEQPNAACKEVGCAYHFAKLAGHGQMRRLFVL